MDRISLMMFATAALALAPLWASAAETDAAASFGAKGDGVTDDTAAIQKALDSAGQNGVVHLAAGSYLISDSLKVPQGKTLLGEGARWENSATRIVVRAPGFAAVRLSHGSSVKGLALTYPNNTDNASPVEYPPAIQLDGINPSVENIVFDCAWIGVSTAPGGRNSGQGMFRDLTGFVHHIGMHLSGCRDVNRIQDVHWFVGGKDTPGKESYFRKNRVGFDFGDVDGILMDGCFIIGGKTFYHHHRLKDTPDGKPELCHSLGHHIDQCWIEDVDRGFVLEGALGFVISGTNILVRDGGVGVRVDADSLFYNAVINGVQVRPFKGPIVGIEYNCLSPHARNRLSIADCQVVGGAPAVHLKSGAVRANIHDCHLQGGAEHPAIRIDKGATLFTITNNVLSGQKAIEDNSGKRASKTISGNLQEK
jgi:hypothetical protein